MEINFSKYSDGLVPAIIQDDRTGKVLMLGFMNQEALDKSRNSVKSLFIAGQKKDSGQKVRKAVIFLF